MLSQHIPSIPVQHTFLLAFLSLQESLQLRVFDLPQNTEISAIEAPASSQGAVIGATAPSSSRKWTARWPWTCPRSAWFTTGVNKAPDSSICGMVER